MTNGVNTVNPPGLSASAWAVPPELVQRFGAATDSRAGLAGAPTASRPVA
ncbi:MAG: hypothetical protein JO287_25730 [Pseudonocardiales bacterium]|nr:hypothetical protein [Pseudonocardiales bacterium]